MPKKSVMPARTALVSSARRINLRKRSDLKEIKGLLQWQKDAWAFYDTIGEVKYAVSLMGQLLSQLELFVGNRPARPDQKPEIGGLDQGPIERFRNDQGDYAEILREIGINYLVPGACYLVGEQQSKQTSEVWECYSKEEIKAEGDKTYVLTEGEWRILPTDSTCTRMWMRHPRKSSEEDSPLRGVLDVCEEIILLQGVTRAVSMSRIAGPGVLLVPSELSFGPVEEDEGEGSEDERDPFMKDLMTAMVTPIEDTRSATGVVPMVVRGDAEHLKEFRHVSLERSVDPILEQKMERAIRRLAQGLPIPPEVLTGMADLNHWTAWLVSDATFYTHIAPLVATICRNLTYAYLWPILEAEGMSSEEAQKQIIWYDASRLIMQPNRPQNAKEAHSSMVISDATYRGVLGFNDEEAPTDEEVLRRVGINKGNVAPDITMALLLLIAEKAGIDLKDLVEQYPKTGQDPNTPGDNPSDPKGSPTPDDDEQPTETDPGAESISSRSAAQEAFGHFLVWRALERAGAHARSQIKSDKRIYEEYRGVPQVELTAALGEQFCQIDVESLAQSAALPAKNTPWVNDEEWAVFAKRVYRGVKEWVWRQERPSCLMPRAKMTELMPLIKVERGVTF